MIYLTCCHGNAGARKWAAFDAFPRRHVLLHHCHLVSVALIARKPTLPCPSIFAWVLLCLPVLENSHEKPFFDICYGTYTCTHNYFPLTTRQHTTRQFVITAARRVARIFLRGGQESRPRERRTVVRSGTDLLTQLRHFSAP